MDARLQKSGARIGSPEAATRIHTLRNPHAWMDQAILASCSWTDIALDHGFHEVDFLPENNRVRFRISPAARGYPPWFSCCSGPLRNFHVVPSQNPFTSWTAGGAWIAPACGGRDGEPAAAAWTWQ